MQCMATYLHTLAVEDLVTQCSVDGLLAGVQGLVQLLCTRLWRNILAGIHNSPNELAKEQWLMLSPDH